MPKPLHDAGLLNDEGPLIEAIRLRNLRLENAMRRNDHASRRQLTQDLIRLEGGPHEAL